MSSNGFDAALAGLRQERAEPPGKIDVGSELHVLFVAQRRQVDRVLHHAELEIFADLHGDLDADGFLRFGG